jgi:hypothetical protein
VKKLLAIGVAVFLALPITAFAHRLDEYLEATILSLQAGRVEGSIRLQPGVAVSSAVIASIDTNGDGVFSDTEQHAYAQHILSNVAVSVDGRDLSLHLVSLSFPEIDAMKQGIGEIHVDFSADVPAGGTNRKLVFENRNHDNTAVYLVNSLVPQDKNIAITTQTRNENQSFYELDFVQSSGPAAHAGSLSLSGFAGAFRLGVRHIAEGTDHLLFLLALLLPAPLLACGRRWSGRATIRGSLMQIFRIVTAFTIGHSLTLALAACGLVRLPSRPVEVLIAVSIFISAVHAIRPLFPEREALIAAFFGLIHGLAFATVISDLGFSGWYRLVSILGFNIGIEAMQLAVVAAILPSLLLLSRTRAYSLLRVSTALFAGLASAGWTIERIAGMQSSVDLIVNSLAHRAAWIAPGLFLASLMCWLFSEYSSLKLRTHFNGVIFSGSTRIQT